MRSFYMKQPDLLTKHKALIEVDGLTFKDLNGNGKLDPYEDWRLSTEERVEDLISQMTIDEKVGMMLINSLFAGKAHPEFKAGGDVLINGPISEEEQGPMGKIMGPIPATDELIHQRQMRHFIARDYMSVSNMVEWTNALNEEAEKTRLGIPVIVASNSRNENADLYMKGDPSEGGFSVYPGTLGLAAATKGDIAEGGDLSLIRDFAETAREEWKANGMRKGYMYMIDVVTDPRWQRIYGTFGEDPEFIAKVAKELILGFQGEELNEDSIALTMKHFPGGGARENGFDPHYAEGKWNIYRTEGSLEDYHLPPFVEAAKHNPASIMPYYSAPSLEKSVYQTFDGELIPFEEVGMAFNEYILNDLLRDQLGFTGYINSDTGVVGGMDWGVEHLSVPAKFAKAINAGTDIIAGSYEVKDLKQAVDNKWIPEQRLDEANKRLLGEMFELGLFDEKTYVDHQESLDFAKDETRHEKAYEAHLKSVTLLKNDGTLPVENKKLYIESFHKDPKKAKQFTDNARKAAQELNLELVYDYKEAEVSVLFLRPESGDYFNPTPGFLELEICEDKTNIALNGDSYTETTVSNLSRYFEIAEYMKENDGKVVTSVNITLPWILGNVEEVSNVLIAGYDTLEKAQLEVLIGNFKPHGKLPITLPKNSAMIAVDEHGKSVTRNDVPGYDKDKYLREGMSYAFVDAAGNKYELDFGLTE